MKSRRLQTYDGCFTQPRMAAFRMDMEKRSSAEGNLPPGRRSTEITSKPDSVSFSMVSFSFSSGCSGAGAGGGSKGAGWASDIDLERFAEGERS